MLENGTKLGPYEISGFVGAGGMGEVYRARDERIGREVAVKILPAAFSEDENRLRRFEQEARAAGVLNHANILSIYDVGNFNSCPYLVSELLEGETLREKLSAGALPRRKSTEYAMQIVQGLAAAHERGIVHRDLKPENLFITTDGRLKILDFGLAKLIQSETASEDQSKLQTQSKPGMVIGTVGYMAPEQIRGMPSDHRADIFAFGTIFYEMLTGRRAFHGGTVADTVSAILHKDPPDLLDSDPNFPAAIQRVIGRCLEKNPGERFQSTRDLFFALEAVSGAGDSRSSVAALGAAQTMITEETKKRRFVNQLSWIIAAAAVALAAAISWIHFRETAPELPLIYSYLLPPEKTNFEMYGEDAAALTISPDGKYVTFSAKSDDGRKMLWLRPLDSESARPLEGTEGAFNPFWSPDSRFIAFFADSKMKKVDIGGGPPLIVCSAGDNSRPGAWNKDGIILFAVSSIDGLSRVPASGGSVTPITTLDASKGETTHRWAAFLPDGNTFLYMAGSHGSGAQSEVNAIYAEKLDSEERKLLLHVRSNVQYAAGYLLYVQNNILMAHAFNPQKLEFAGTPIPVAERIQYDGAFFHASFAVSNNGILVYRQGQADSNKQIKWVDRSGKEISLIGDPVEYQSLGASRSAVLSPSGDRIAASITDPKNGTTDIWIIEFQRNVKTRFTFSSGNEAAPLWSPDGSEIVYSAIPKGSANFDLFMKPSTGSGSEELLVSSKSYKLATSWSPDGKYIAFSSFDPQISKSDQMILSLPDKKVTPFLETEFSENDGQFSPDGRWMLYESNESGQNETYLVPFPGPGGKWQVSTGGSGGAMWSHRGDQIYYAKSDGSILSVPVKIEGTNVQLGAPQMLFQNPAVENWSPAPDDKRFLIVQGVQHHLNTPITVVTNWVSMLKIRNP